MTPDPREQSLAPVGETLPDATVPERAGAIVSEVIRSISEEAMARAAALREEAEAEASARRQAAIDSSQGVRQKLDALAGEMASLHSVVRKEMETLGSGLEHFTGEAPPRSLPRPSTHAARKEGDEAAIPEVEVVEEATVVDATEPGEGEETGVTATATRGPMDERRAKLAAMSDRELAETYVEARRLIAGGEQSDGGGRSKALVDAIVDEGAMRPAYNAESTASSAGVLRRLGRRRQLAAMADLQRAVQRRRAGIET